MDREKIMQQWDYWRGRIATGDWSSSPRDWFESVLDAYDEIIEGHARINAELLNQISDLRAQLNEKAKDL